VTDDSAFKKQVRGRMAETGEKYTVARRMVIAGRDPGQPPVLLRVHLNPQVDLELTAEEGRAYAAADEQGRLEIAGRLLLDQIEGAGFAAAQVAAGSTIVTGQRLHAEAAATVTEAAGTEAETAEAETAETIMIRGAVQRSIERAVGLSAVEIDRAADRLHVSIRAARPGVAWGVRRDAGAEGIWRETEAERLRRELEELTGKPVRLDIQEAPSRQEAPQNEGAGRGSR
jgi:hypothetical protein